MSVGPGVAKQLRGVLEDVPHVQHAFAYGSGVIVQPDLYDRHSTNKPMLDFIFAVDNPHEWHAQVCAILFICFMRLQRCKRPGTSCHWELADLAVDWALSMCDDFGCAFGTWYTPGMP